MLCEQILYFTVLPLLHFAFWRIILQNLTEIDMSSPYWGEFRYSCIYPYWFRRLDVGYYAGPQNEWGYFEYRTTDQKLGMFLAIYFVFWFGPLWDFYAIYTLIRYHHVEKGDSKRFMGPWKIYRIDWNNMKTETVYL